MNIEMSQGPIKVLGIMDLHFEAPFLVYLIFSILNFLAVTAIIYFLARKTPIGRIKIGH